MRSSRDECNTSYSGCPSHSVTIPAPRCEHPSALSRRDTARAMSQENVERLRGVRTTLPPGHRASQRRTLDERLWVRFPGLRRLSGRALFRLRPRSRLRQSILARAFSRAYAAANRRDFELILVGNDPGRYEYHPSVEFLPPDMDAVYHGHEGYRQFWRQWLDAFEDIRWDPEEIVDFGEKALVTTQQSGHGSGSGVAVSQPVFQLFTFRQGLVIRQEDFASRSKALEAAGLRE
jgi:SnoaL-like domain